VGNGVPSELPFFIGLINCQTVLHDVAKALENTACFDLRLAIISGTSKIIESFTASDPGNIAIQRELSVARDLIGDLLLEQGDLHSALAAYQEALSIRASLTANPSLVTTPYFEIFQRDLAVGHVKVGDVFAEQGLIQDAIQSYQAAHEILIKHPPTTVEFGIDLSVSHERIGKLMLQTGNLNGALNSFKASFEVAERCALADPSNTSLQRTLSISHSHLGDVLRHKGDLNGARREYHASLAIDQRLIATDPAVNLWQHDLSSVLLHLSDIQMELGELHVAEQSVRTALEILQHLADADWETLDKMYGLSVCNSHLARVLKSQGRLQAAELASSAALEFSKGIAAGAPENPRYQHQLALSLSCLGDLRVRQSDDAGALTLYMSALSVSGKLSTISHSNLEWQRTLWLTHYHIASLLAGCEDSSADTHYRQAYEIIFGTKRRGFLPD